MPHTTANTATISRPPLRYSVEGLSPRDELLLKSLVRLLGHRTQQQWEYTLTRGDVHVVCEGLPAGARPAAHDGKPAQTLVLGHGGESPNPPCHYLRLPLHANELEQMLNKVGMQLVQSSSLPPCAAQALASAGKPLEPLSAMSREYRLVRWPSSALLAAPGRMKLATLMTGGAISLTLLEQRSAQSHQACIDFLRDLHQAGLLQMAQSLPTAPAAPAMPAVQAATQSQQAAGASQPPDSRMRPPAGLLARIRSRLGLAPRGSA